MGLKILDSPSPNSNPRPTGERVKLIVLHSTGGNYAGALSWLTSRKSRVSAHYLVSRKGTVAKLVPCTRRAWHAGKSSYQGTPDVNDFSIGIEQEHLDGKQDWPWAQLDTVADLCAALCKVYGLSPSQIVGHADVAPGRKVDPKNFPWGPFREAVADRLKLG